jgi:hypothetical protein
MANYYCYISGLPELTLDTKITDPDFNTYQTQLSELLDNKGYAVFKNLISKADHKEIAKEVRDKLVTFTEEYEIEEWMVEAKEEYMTKVNYLGLFFDLGYEKLQSMDLVELEIEIDRAYFTYNLSDAKGFARKWIELELNIRNYLATYQCEKYRLDKEAQIINLNSISEILLENSCTTRELDAEWGECRELDSIMEIPHLHVREKTLDKFRWQWIESYSQFEYFSEEVLMAYGLKLQIINRWQQLEIIQEEKGVSAFEILLNQINETKENAPEE